MKRSKLLIAAAFASAVTLSTVANAANVSVELNVGPPPPRYEVIPAPRIGYVWSRGYWDYDHGHHAWRAGHWEKERAGRQWSQAAWEERDGHWYLNRGHWEDHH